MNRRKAILFGMCVPAAVKAVAQERDVVRLSGSSGETLAQGEGEKRILGVISQMVSSNKVYLSVSPQVGRILRLLTEASGAKRVAEIGTSTGYSGLWFSLALQRTGGNLTTFEIDHGRAETARKHFAAAGVEHIVKVVEGDAHKNIGQLEGPLDVVFLDADKPGYLDYLQRLLPLLKPGGFILADNFDWAQDYKRAVTTNPGLETLVLADAEEGRSGGRPGFGITLKKR